MIFRPLLVWCDLAGALAGDAPWLESLLVNRGALLRGQWQAVTRMGAAPEPGSVPIPVGATWLGEHLVYHCSAPILSKPGWDVHEHYGRRFPVEYAPWLAPEERTQINRTGGEFKSYFLPNRVRGVQRICWIVEGNWREMRELLRDVHHVGKDRGQGHGAVRRTAAAAAEEVKVLAWDHAERPDLAGCWWYAPHPEGGPVLMRNLPLGPWLPEGLVGGRRGYDAVSPPPWHPARKTEVMVPC